MAGNQYLQEHILDPLGMAYSTVRSPMPPGFSARKTVGYTYVDGAFQVFPDYLGQLATVPAGGMAASAADMARFMIAHLQGGRYSDENIPKARILSESTVQQMHSNRGSLFCLVAEPVESAGLAVLAGRRFKAGRKSFPRQ